MTRYIYWALMMFLILWCVFYFYSFRTYFITPFNAREMSKVYSESQYVLGTGSKGGIGDDGLYAFAGYYYFFQGGDVSSVNFEHPPLGKYLIGLSLFLFHNENVINILYFIALLGLSYSFGLVILRNKLLSLLGVIFVAIDPLLLDHVLRSQLDLPFSVFFLAAAYFFILSQKKAGYIYISNFFWGLAFSTRFFPLYVVIWTITLIYLWLNKKSLIKKYITSSLLIPVIYLICHISFFVYHPSFIEFLRHKKWMLAWYRGTPIITGNIWKNIYTGTYLDSTRLLAKNQYWWPFLPFIYTFAILRFRPSMLKYYADPFILTYGFMIFFLFYVTFATNGLQKFVMPVYPLVILLALSNIEAMYSIIKHSHARFRSTGNKRKTH
jgi:predicted membrane-bound dolichyl-phosphate-mannose-protein mannosyltransferase